MSYSGCTGIRRERLDCSYQIPQFDKGSFPWGSGSKKLKFCLRVFILHTKLIQSCFLFSSVL